MARSRRQKPRVISLSEVRDRRGEIAGWNVVIGVPAELADLAAA